MKACFTNELFAFLTELKGNNNRDWFLANKHRYETHLRQDSLIRPPKGFAADHPLIKDLKRKDFVASVMFRDSDVTDPGFLPAFAGHAGR